MVVSAAQGARFPALDPEPPPHPWWHGAALAALVVTVAGGSVALGLVLSDRGGHSSTADLPSFVQTGRILSLDPSGNLLESRPDARRAVTLPGLGRFQQGGLPSVAPGGGLVAFPDGLVLSTDSGRPAVRARLNLGPRQVLAPASAFSAGLRDVVVETEGQYLNESTSIGVSVVNVTTASSDDLGMGSLAAGDPMAPGALVVVPSGQQAVTGVQNSATPASGLELRDVGRPNVQLATATSLATDLGLDTSTPVSLLPVPSPSGVLVAVEVENLLQPAGSDAGLVVLDRRGKVMAVQSSGLGPDGGIPPSWSPDGTTLAYSSEGAAGSVMDLWSLGGDIRSLPLPATARRAKCLWSPAGTAVLCDSAHGSGGRIEQTWSLAAAGGGQVTELSGSGFAIDWYPG